MPISDAYVVQYLLQGTRPGNGQIQWQERDDDGYTATVNGIRLELDSVPARSGARLFLTLTCGREKVGVAEPLNTGIFREKYQDEDQRRLAHLLRDLARAAARQCAARHTESVENASVIREAIFRRLLGAHTAEG
jgi:hypothetical protein